MPLLRDARGAKKIDKGNPPRKERGGYFNGKEKRERRTALPRFGFGVMQLHTTLLRQQKYLLWKHGRCPNNWSLRRPHCWMRGRNVPLSAQPVLLSCSFFSRPFDFPVGSCFLSQIVRILNKFVRPTVKNCSFLCRSGCSFPIYWDIFFRSWEAIPCRARSPPYRVVPRLRALLSRLLSPGVALVFLPAQSVSFWNQHSCFPVGSRPF